MRNSSQSIVEKIILGLVFILANVRATVFVFLFPDTSKLLGPAWMEILLWALAAIGVLILLVREGHTAAFLAMWRRNWPIAVFIVLTFVSTLWSVAPVATVFRCLELLFATLTASYFGMRLLPQQLMTALFWFGAVMYILSIALVYGAPPTGTMYWNPFNGAWRGLYWHRNHLASIAAFLSSVYLIRILMMIKERDKRVALDVFFYALSLVILFFAKSATGSILFIILNLFVLVVWLWLRISDRLKKWHYLLLLGLGLFTLVLILMNLNFVFGFFNRDATMTGRVSLWRHLLQLASDRPWLGHGFGAIWTLDTFRNQIMVLDKWYSQPLIGDNGFLDIYLHLGVIGLIVFIGVLVFVAVHSVRYALTQKSMSGFFPLLVFVYAIFGNITFSLFIETEVFVWFLIVASLFMTMSPMRMKVTMLQGIQDAKINEIQPGNTKSDVPLVE